MELIVPLGGSVVRCPLRPSGDRAATSTVLLVIAQVLGVAVPMRITQRTVAGAKARGQEVAQAALVPLGTDGA
jgi:hypothetical protein